MKLKHIVILQNKIDLVKEAQAKEQYEQILKFIQGTLLVTRHIVADTIEKNPYKTLSRCTRRELSMQGLNVCDYWNIRHRGGGRADNPDFGTIKV
jgi:hypothetical protein